MKWFRHLNKYSIGIDFGTTMSRLSYVNNQLRVSQTPDVKPLRSLALPLPDETGAVYHWLTGGAIQTRKFACFKLYMGHMDTEQQMISLRIRPYEKREREIEMRPEILAARIIWELWNRTIQENKLDLRSSTDVTVTVPAEWNAMQRQATVAAAKIAGFTNVHLIEEPVAAYIAITQCHDIKQIQDANKLLIFDYGGGTLDVTVIEKPNRKFGFFSEKKEKLPYVIGRAMESEYLGGEHIDRFLAKKLVGEDCWTLLTVQDKQKLAALVKEAKEMLNPEKLEQEPPPYIPLRAIELQGSKLEFASGELKLDRKEMEGYLGEIADQVMIYVDMALDSACCSANDIDTVVMVGGSSYLHTIRQKIEKKFPRKSFGRGIYLRDPEKLVAIGAALYQSSLDRGKDLFQLKAPMETYVVHDKQKPPYILASPTDDLPKAPTLKNPPPVIDVPKGEKVINWAVEQRHTYSTKTVDVVERVLFDNYTGKPDHIRLEYEIDLNGCLINWNPVLIRDQSQPLTTGNPRQYDWQDTDFNALAKKYTIDNPKPS